MRIDPHIHLGGAIPVSFVWDTIKADGLRYLAESREQVRQAMTFSTNEQHGFHRFLDKFKLLDELRWTEELIDRSIAAVSHNLINDNIDYSWMRFSVNKYMNSMKWHRRDAIRFISDCFERHAPGRVGLILSLKYESTRANQRQLGKLINDPAVADSLVGIDLVGDESYFCKWFYKTIFESWQSAGKKLFAHVGESQSAENVRSAIDIGVKQIAHGIKIWDCPDIIALALDNDVCFDMALTSNYVTRVWTDRDWHPIRALFDAGLDCTIGTDDPIQLSKNGKRLSLDDEYGLLSHLGFSPAELVKVAETAVRRTSECRNKNERLKPDIDR